jgi:hypothetical protein
MPPSKNKSTTSPLPPINGASGGVTETIFNNPFILPGDDQIFRMREEEKRKKEGQREDSGKLEVWQKNKTDLLSRTERLKDLIGKRFIINIIIIIVFIIFLYILLLYYINIYLIALFSIYYIYYTILT